jgi:hypothetical protein
MKYNVEAACGLAAANGDGIRHPAVRRLNNEILVNDRIQRK